MVPTPPQPKNWRLIKDSEEKKITIPNPYHAVWLAKDQTVMTYLTKSMNLDILAQIIGLEHASGL
jgi:hypothetical protein